MLSQERIPTTTHIKRSKRHKSRRNKKNKSKKRKKNKGVNKSVPRKNKGAKQNISNTDNKTSYDLPIITEEDHEDGSFSDSYIPTRYDASGFFSYHTWGTDSAVRPPNADRVVRSGPSLWHWSWDLSFGLYDDLYDNYIINKKTKRHRNALYLEDTWLNMEGPIPWWQPLFAAMIWFIISMYILFPVSIIAESTPSHLNEEIDRERKEIHITSSYPHFSVGLILFSFEITSWITTRISLFLIFKIGPSLALFIGILLMMISSILMSFTFSFYDIEFILFNCLFRMFGGIGFNIVRSSTLLLWSCFAKLDMLSSGLGFCVGPVFGDLLYTYIGLDIAYIVFSVLLFLLLSILTMIILFNLLSLQQISSVEIPNHIVNIRKPRHDIIRTTTTTYQYFILFFKLEIMSITIIGLTSLEPTLPIYALNPSLSITVSGALFTFIYLPLLACASLIALVFAKSSSIYKHVEYKRRGMKYITKTLSININGMNKNMNGDLIYNNNKRFNISKCEKIKVVSRPSWLNKKKRLLPSTDISQHHMMLLFGLFIMSFGSNILSGNAHSSFITNSNGIDLVLGLVLISIGSSFILVSCFDSFINGLILNLNQTQLTYFVLNISILCGPLLGGIMLDIKDNDFIQIANYYSIIISIHFILFFWVLIIKYCIKCVHHFFCRKRIKKENKNVLKSSLAQSLIEQQNTKKTKSILPLIRDLSTGKIEPSMHRNVNGSPKQQQQKVNIVSNHCNINIKMLKDADVKQLKQRVIKHKEKEEKEDVIKTNKVYIYGTDLRHLCWWKRGLNVRFPYVQWLESGWSSSNQNMFNKQQNRNQNQMTLLCD